jgi:hypothetical protein
MNATGSKQMYNGYSAAYISSSGARRNAVIEAADCNHGVEIHRGDFVLSQIDGRARHPPPRPGWRLCQ